MSALFLIVAGGEPLYELDVAGAVKSDDVQHLNEFVAHAALDLVDSASWTTNTT
jgi:hypothetical protein